MKRFKTIGVLGGIGPSASAYFYQLLVDLAQKKYGAVQDGDFPHILVNSLDFRGSNEFGVEDSELILSQLRKGVMILEKAEADFIVIACNSVHNVYTYLIKTTKLHIINLIAEVTKEVIKSKKKKILILASETTKKYELYSGLSSYGIEIIRPSTKLQKNVTKLILSVMGGTNWKRYKLNIVSEINSIASKGLIDSVLLACTELPLIIHKEDLQAKSFDSLRILADTTLDFAQISKD